MKKIQYLWLMFALCLALLPSVSAELQAWSGIIIHNDTQMVTYHTLYAIEDTSETNVGNNKNIPITIFYQTNPLPYDLTPYGFAGSVDYCNLTITHNKNVYSSAGLSANTQLINSSDEIQSYLFNSGVSTGLITIQTRNRDVLSADMSCHYTNASSLFVNNDLFGSFSTYFPSYECAECSSIQQSQLNFVIENTDNITASENRMYDNIQTAVGWNFQIWLILSWIIKLSFIFIAVSLIFAGFYWTYSFLQKIAKETR